MLPVNLEDFLRTVGYAGLFVIIFAESGLLIGFFLPGDSLLFAAGILSSQGRFNPAAVVIGCAIAAIAGDAVGYAFGRNVGRRLYDRPESRWFKRRHLTAAEAFYAKHGGKTIIFARFLPVVRTFAPIVAGASNMRYARFLSFNVIGGVLWGAGVAAAGYVLGSAIPSIDRYLLPIIAVIIVVSASPSIIHLLRANHGQIRAHLGRSRNERPATLTPPPVEERARE